MLSRAPRRNRRRRTRTHLNGFLRLGSVGLSGLGLSLHLQASRVGGRSVGDERKTIRSRLGCKVVRGEARIRLVGGRGRWNRGFLYTA